MNAATVSEVTPLRKSLKNIVYEINVELHITTIFCV